MWDGAMRGKTTQYDHSVLPFLAKTMVQHSPCAHLPHVVAHCPLQCVMFGSEVYTYGWSCDLPRVPATDNNKLFTNSGTAYVMCGTTNYTMAEYTTATGGYDTHTKVATAPSLSQVLQWGREVLQM